MPRRWIMKITIEGKQPMHSPSHPGEVLNSMYIEPMGVSITEAAEALGVSRKHLSAIVNGSAPVSPDMAARLAWCSDRIPRSGSTCRHSTICGKSARSGAEVEAAGGRLTQQEVEYAVTLLRASLIQGAKTLSFVEHNLRTYGAGSRRAAPGCSKEGSFRKWPQRWPQSVTGTLDLVGRSAEI
jgi:addiction module HigA family antidote